MGINSEIYYWYEIDCDLIKDCCITILFLLKYKRKCMLINIDFFDCTEDGIKSELPKLETYYSACADVRARFHSSTVLTFNRLNECTRATVHRQKLLSDYFILYPGERACVPTGWRMKIPHGYQIKLVPRSGLALKKGITLINTPGTIDSDYTDELKVILLNTSDVQYKISDGDRICQMEIMPNLMLGVNLVMLDDSSLLDVHKSSSNRTGGMGSTGK